MERRALVSALAAAVTAVFSAVILYETMIVNNRLGEPGLLRMFLASMFCHLTVVGRGLFVPAFMPLASIYHPLLLGSFAGWGGALGEVTTYYWGLSVGKALEEKNAEDKVSSWINKYGLTAIMLVAASPLPDTPIILLAGSTRFSLPKLLLVEGIGKTLWYSLGAFFGGFIFMGISNILGNLLTSSIIVAASTAFCIIVSWKKTRERVLQTVKRLAS